MMNTFVRAANDHHPIVELAYTWENSGALALGFNPFPTEAFALPTLN